MELKPKFFVGTCLVTLALHGNRSLKGKRSVLNRIKSRVKNRFNVSIAEVGNNSSLQKALLGISSVANDKVYLEGQMTKVVNFIAGISDATVADVQTMIELKGEEDHVFL
jgi:hypothetical protein